jgi:hypothetical protein
VHWHTVKRVNANQSIQTSPDYEIATTVAQGHPRGHARDRNSVPDGKRSRGFNCLPTNYNTNAVFVLDVL